MYETEDGKRWRKRRKKINTFWNDFADALSDSILPLYNETVWNSIYFYLLLKLIYNEIRTFFRLFTRLVYPVKSTSIGIVDAGHRIMNKIPASLIYQNQLNYCAITYIRWNIYWFFGLVAFFLFPCSKCLISQNKNSFSSNICLFDCLFARKMGSLSDLISHVLIVHIGADQSLNYLVYVHICLNN